MANEVKVLNQQALEKLCRAIKGVANVGEKIDDNNIATDSTYSSFKIEEVLEGLETELYDYMSGYYTNTEVDDKFALKIDKDKIVTVLDDTVTDEQVPSAKAVKEALDNASTDNSTHKIDITTLTPVFPSEVVVDSGGVAINYIVRNGWCSVNFAFNIASVTAFSWIDIATGLPKPANSVYILLMNEGGKINRPIAIKINSTGSVSSRIPVDYDTTDWWAGNISYPVAE